MSTTQQLRSISDCVERNLHHLALKLEKQVYNLFFFFFFFIRLLLERAERFRDAVEARRALERSWAENLRRKRLRERDEKDLRVQSPGVLIQEQCDKYHRCGQCGRRPWNCGESNIWRESRYIAGSRLIV